MSWSNLGKWLPNFLAILNFFSTNVPIFVDSISKFFNACSITTHLGCDTCHARTGESVKDDITWIGVVQYVPSDCLRWNFSVICVSAVY